MKCILYLHNILHYARSKFFLYIFKSDSVYGGHHAYDTFAALYDSILPLINSSIRHFTFEVLFEESGMHDCRRAAWYGKGEKVFIKFRFDFRNKSRDQFIRYATRQVVLNTPGINSLHRGIHNTYYYHKLSVAYFYAHKK